MQSSRPRFRLFTNCLTSLALALLALVLTGCQGQLLSKATGLDLPKTLKSIESTGDWQPAEAARLFAPDTLYDLMNGQSDAFFVYGFQKAAVQRFNGPQGAVLIASLFQVDAPDSAYGLFSANRDPQPLELGNEGSGSPGQRLSFWQDRYFVQLTALSAVEPAMLEAAGLAIAAALPEGGQIPALMTGLPQPGLLTDTPPVYFHQELSIQDRLWLGGRNLLNLSLETDGVLAFYSLDNQVVMLALIEYPGAQPAGQGLQALEAAGLADLDILAAKTEGRRLALVSGPPNLPAAGLAAVQQLIVEALR